MDKNESYKDSGIKWIGEIPKHWEISKIKYIHRQEHNSFIDGDWIESPFITDQGIRYITTGNIGEGFFKFQGNSFISEESFGKLGCTEVFPGDLVISRLSPPVGRSCIIPNLGYRIVTSVDNVIIRLKNHLIIEYYNYLFNSKHSYDNTSTLSRGATLTRISRSMLGNIETLVPPLEEQRIISRYLDKRTERIDSLIEKIQKKIELLKEQRTLLINQYVTKGLYPNVKMKDSGVEWVGQIPEHWSIKKIKFLSERKSGDGFRIELQGSKNGIIPFYKVSDTNNVGNDKYLITSNNYLDPKIVKENNFRIFPKSTIVFPKIGATLKLNKRRILTKNSCIDNNMMGLTITTTDNVEYIHLAMTLINFEMYCSEGTIPSISETQVGRIHVPLPSKNEQQEIVDYVNKRTYFIDIIIQKESSRISILSEYRQSLISSVVTGKIRITENMV